MKVLILAGGYGTRLGEETDVRPKPMVEIGDKPILWHIMKSYSHYGFNDFIILCGYKGHKIKEYFYNYYLHSSSVTFDLKNNNMEAVHSEVEPWKVTLLDTGIDTLTGGRIKKAQTLIGDEPFLLTYGDGVCDVNILETVKSHNDSGKEITMVSVQPDGRFGTLVFDNDNEVAGFKEKEKGATGWINGGFFVCNPSILDYIEDKDSCIFEREPLEKLALEKKINSFRHDGFWECMDTLADKKNLEAMWNRGEAPWKIW